ncbi:transposable element Tcb1 transposase [Trichonephila clavipes]|nr:transposable element Tcb1 transposase [Trichonephila clavipes]
MHRPTGPAPRIIGGGCYGFHCHTPLIRIACTLNTQAYISEVVEPVVLPYIQCLPSAIFQQNDARPHVVSNVQELFTHQMELLYWLACSPNLLQIENVRSKFGQRLARDTSPTVTPDQLW